ncbi:MAG: Gfo/Idh/MocA family oxidoreductase [Acidobacteriota bacterium]
MPIAVAAAKAGKHVICEKPIALNAGEARQMLDAVREGNVRHMVAFNYRRVPAIALARQMIQEGKIGRVFHFNAVYYQDWLVDPDFPYVWRHDKRAGGFGAHGDMNAHTVDLARFLVGEIEAVCGAEEVFIKERRLPAGDGKGIVTADDALYFLARFRDGALGTFMATRFASGRKNYLRLEIFGSEGSLMFNLAVSLLRNPAVLLAAMALVCYIGLEWTMNNWTKPLMVEVFQSHGSENAARNAGLVLALFGLAMGIRP